MKFEIGQIVELINNNGMNALLSATAVVTRANYFFMDFSLIGVIWKRNWKQRGQGDGGYGLYHFKPLMRKNEQLVFSFMQQS